MASTPSRLRFWTGVAWVRFGSVILRSPAQPTGARANSKTTENHALFILRNASEDNPSSVLGCHPAVRVCLSETLNSSNFGLPCRLKWHPKAAMNRVSQLMQIALPLVLAGYMAAQTQPAPAPGANPPAAQAAATGQPAAKPAYDPLLDFPPLPHDRVTLIGGTVTKLDQVQDKMTIQPFGSGKKMHVAFDVRTNFLRNGAAAKQHDLRTGDRVYL